MSDDFGKDPEIKVVPKDDPRTTPKQGLVPVFGAALLCIGIVVYGVWFKDPAAPPPVQATAPANLPTAAFGGIGAGVNPSPKGPVIARAYPGTPSARAGLQKGDILLTVDGHDVTGMDVPGVSNLLRGPDGSTITLTYSRDGGPPQSVSFKREIIQPSVFKDGGGK